MDSVQLVQKQTISHRLVLTQTMRQSLRCLQFSAQELNDFVQDAALSNPMLEVTPAEFYDVLPLDALSAVSLMPDGFPHKAPDGAEQTVETLPQREQTLAEALSEQLGQMHLLDNRTRVLCEYLIGCLDQRGYLDCPLGELSAEIGCSVAELEQALYVVQMLEPIGVGARDLSECLILQLAQSDHFDRLTLTIARGGLELLARRDYSALGRLLGVSSAEAKRAANVLLALDPIPARGFSAGGYTTYLLPDATVCLEDGKLRISLNNRILPKLSLHSDYATLAECSCEDTTRRYAKEMLAQANTLIRDVQMRNATLLRLLDYLVREQSAFFSGLTLHPLTMQQAAEALAVSVSTVSRTVQNKYLQFDGKLYPLRDFFSAAVSGSSDNISVQALRERIAYLIAHEDKSTPLSDEALRGLLEADGISLTRRAVAGHRNALDIPFASRRKAN